MTRISMLRDGTWYTLKVASINTQPVDKEAVLAEVGRKHTAFAHDKDVQEIVEAMRALGIEVKSRTH